MNKKILFTAITAAGTLITGIIALQLYQKKKAKYIRFSGYVDGYDKGYNSGYEDSYDIGFTDGCHYAQESPTMQKKKVVAS
ncbi:MAG: hypothetical protein LUC50_04385 [Ruminococcus sp.]|nr:hypothetical protein [Ruminococcus sp.]